VIEPNGDLLGGRISGQEGAGFFAGADLNEASYGGGASETAPRTLTLNPIDVTGETDLELTVAVAGTNIDFETNDFLRILADPDGDGPAPFVTLANYAGNGTGALANGTHVLGNEFEDITLPLPAGATNLVIKFEAFSTFFNEILAIDNVRIKSASVDTPGDTDGDGDVDLNDLNNVRNNFGSANPPIGDTDDDNDVDLDDLNAVRNNFGAVAGANAVPEPATWALALIATCATWLGARRRTR
jgi:hypothetical protein